MIAQTPVDVLAGIVSIQAGVIVALAALVARLRERVARIEEWARLEEKRIDRIHSDT